MAISQDEKDELKLMVLLETEKMFSRITSKFQSPKNREQLHYLLDVESAMKERLVEIDFAAKK